MDLYFRGHDYRYAVEQTMLTLFPGQLPRYPQGEPEGASPSALVTLEEEQDGAFAARAVLWWEGRRYEAGAAARVEPGSDALSARRARPFMMPPSRPWAISPPGGPSPGCAR